MIQLELEIEIERPVEEVFARLADIDHYREWLPKSLIFKGGGLVRILAMRERSRVVEELKRSFETT